LSKNVRTATGGSRIQPNLKYLRRYVSLSALRPCLFKKGVEFLPLMRLDSRGLKIPQSALAERITDDRIPPMGVQVLDDPGIQLEEVEELNNSYAGDTESSCDLGLRADFGTSQFGMAAARLIQG
jgi:hypothetical protein